MANRFQTSQLLKSISNYPVIKGGPGSGRYPAGSHAERNHTVESREEMIAIDTDIAQKYYKLQEAIADEMVAEHSAAMYATRGLEVIKTGYGKQQRTVYTTVTGEQMISPSPRELIEARLAGKFGEFPETGRYGSPADYQKQFDEAVAEHKKTEEDLATARAIYKEANSHYEGWNRYFGVQNGHIHSSMDCHSCNNGLEPTSFVWLPQLSGATEEEAVAAGGETLCTHCFPSAPVEWTNRTFSTARVAGDLHTRADFAGQDLSDKDFSEQRGKDMNFSGATLVGTNFTKATVVGSNFSGSDLTNADLTKANAERANFSGATLAGATLAGAKLSEAKLENADLSGANLMRAKLWSTSFDGANLQGIQTAASAKVVGGLGLNNATFEGADLRNADLRGFEEHHYTPSFAMADLSGSTFADPKLNNKDFSVDWRAELRANFSGANLANVNFAGRRIGGDFTDADLTNANFTKVELSFVSRDNAGATFNGADLAFANIEGADFTVADFTGAKNLDKVQGEPAKIQGFRGGVDRTGEYALPDGYDWSPTKGIFQK